MAGGIGVTQRDRERMGELARLTQPNGAPPIPDPVEIAPSWDGKDLNLPESVGEAIVAFAEAHTNAEAARRFGLSERTVERHRAGEIEYVEHAHITAAHCVVVREMARDGFSLGEIADQFGFSKGAVHRHTSAVGECQHDVPVPRVDLTGRRCR